MSEKRQFKDAQAAMSGLGAELHEQEKKEENKMDTRDILEKNLISKIKMQWKSRKLDKLFSEISKACEWSWDLVKCILFKK